MSWTESIQKASMKYQQYLNLFKSPIPSITSREDFFATLLDLTIVSASGLPMTGPSDDDLPWPYCEVSLCLRCRRTNVILSTRFPQWNRAFRFTVKDLARDVVTFKVYSKKTSSSSELIGKTEVQMAEIAEHCRQGGATWKTVLPLTLVSSNSDLFASLLVSFALTENVSELNYDDL